MMDVETVRGGESRLPTMDGLLEDVTQCCKRVRIVRENTFPKINKLVEDNDSQGFTRVCCITKNPFQRIENRSQKVRLEKIDNEECYKKVECSTKNPFQLIENKTQLVRLQKIEDEQCYRRVNPRSKQEATERTINTLLNRFIEKNWQNFVGEKEQATKEDTKNLVKKVLRRNNKNEYYNESVFEKTFNDFGRWALTKDHMKEFIRIVLPILHFEGEANRT